MDTLTRMADQLRAEKERLTNELEGYKKTALIAQYDAIVAAISAFDYETNDERMEYGDWMRKETILTIIAQYDPRNTK